MRNVIRQSVVLPASAKILFEMYLNPSTHRAITGTSVEIGDKRGSEFKAFESDPIIWAQIIGIGAHMFMLVFFGGWRLSSKVLT